MHLCDDYKLLRQWRWGHLVYFACRYTGLLTTISFLVLACVGSKPNADTLCQGFYVFEHITSSLLFLSTGAMFWLRAGFICQWKRRLMIPLALYGLTISALAMRSDVADIRRTEFLGDSTEEPSLVCAISSSTKVEQAILRFLMASFDVLTAVITFTYLYKKKAPQSWLKALLTRDQVSSLFEYRCICSAADLPAPSPGTLEAHLRGCDDIGVHQLGCQSLDRCEQPAQLSRCAMSQHHVCTTCLSVTIELFADIATLQLDCILPALCPTKEERIGGASCWYHFLQHGRAANVLLLLLFTFQVKASTK